jgi:DNA processing protein
MYRVMTSGRLDEHAALVALLRAQPNGLSWPEIAAELLDSGSAAEIWDRHAPAPALISLPDEITPDSVAEDLRSWQARGYRLLSILDDDYPVRLRGVQQAPPVIFTRGSVIADDPAVSVIGSREASDFGLALAVDVARAGRSPHDVDLRAGTRN